MILIKTATSALSAQAAKSPAMFKTAVVAALRGGGTAPAVKLQDFSGAAAEYFSGIRTPSSLILGASLGALFTDHANTDDMRQKTRAERLCTRFYNTCVLISFVLSLSCTVTATAAGVTILHSDFLPNAESAYHLLMREFEFEFTTCRLSYLVSLLSFVIGITSRTLLDFKLLHKDHREEACVVCFSIGAVVAHLWSYINSTLYSSQSLVGLGIKLYQLVLRRAFHDHRPLQIVSLVCSATSIYFFIRVLFFKKKGDLDDVIL